jgi:hypothetical protein
LCAVLDHFLSETLFYRVRKSPLGLGELGAADELKDAPAPDVPQPQIRAVVETIGNKPIFCHIIKNSEKNDYFV